GLPRARVHDGRARAARLARFPQRGLRRHLRRALPCDTRSHRSSRIRRLRRLAAALAADEAPHRGGGPPAMKVAVVGGGLAGLSAALDLVDAGHEVTLYEARPTLGGAVQTLPHREGDPEPPPDNGQHIGLACFTEYIRFLHRIGEQGSVWRLPLALPVIDERGRAAVIKPSALALLRYRHVPFGDRVRILTALARWR